MSAQSRIWRVNVDYRMVGDLPAVESANQIFINQDEFAEFEKIFAQKINKNAVRNCKLAVVKKLLRELNAFKKIAYDSTGHKEIKKTFKITRSDFVDDVVVEVYLQKTGKDLLASRVIVSGHTQSSAAVVHCFDSLLDESTFADRWTKTGVLGLGVLGVVGYLRDWHQPYAQRMTDWAFADKPFKVTGINVTGIRDKLFEIFGESNSLKFGQRILGSQGDVSRGGLWSWENEQCVVLLQDTVRSFGPGLGGSPEVLFNMLRGNFWGQFHEDGDVSKPLLLKKGQKFSLVIPLSVLAEVWRMMGKIVCRNADGSQAHGRRGAPLYDGAAFSLTDFTEDSRRLAAFESLPIKWICDETKRTKSTWQQIKDTLGRENVQLLVVDDLPEKSRRISSRFWERDGEMPFDPLGWRDGWWSGAEKEQIVKFFILPSSSEFSSTRAQWLNSNGTFGKAIH
jgi:hypothetical protein